MRDSWYNGISSAFLENTDRHDFGRRRALERQKFRESVRENAWNTEQDCGYEYTSTYTGLSGWIDTFGEKLYLNPNQGRRPWLHIRISAPIRFLAKTLLFTGIQPIIVKSIF